MRIGETIEGLNAFAGRGAGRDAERRAASWLARELRRDGQEVELETFWCRPAWPLAQAWHVALGIAGSLLAVSHPKIGAVLILLAALAVVADAATGVSPGRRLTPERASQNVISRPRRPQTPHQARVELLLTANIDAGRTGLVHRPGVRRLTARLRQRLGGRAPGWAGWLALTLVWALVVALVRVQGSRGTAVSVAQLIPTVALVLALALLLELGTGDWSPGANDNASGVAVALALARALGAAPPGEAAVTLVLTGAGDGQGIGLRRHLRRRRHDLRAGNTIVLGIGPSGAGTPHWLASDGPLFPLASFGQLRRLAQRVATDDPSLALRERRSRGASPALAARARGIPSIALGSALEDGTVPHSHCATDTPDRLDPAAAERVLQAAIQLVDAIDEHLAERPARD